MTSNASWQPKDAESGVRPSGAPEKRLLNLHEAAAYLGLSYWSVRDYVLQGLIPVVEMPTLRPKEGARQTGRTLRRVLIDRCDADRFIEERKRR